MNRKYKIYALPAGLLAIALVAGVFGFSRGAMAENAVPASYWNWHTIGGGGEWSSGATYQVFSTFGTAYPFGMTANSEFVSYSGFLYPLDRVFGVKNDFDGDRNADIAVYREGDGAWSLLLSGSGYAPFYIYGWGGANFMPVASDYDGDMITDPAVYNTATGEWRLWLSTAGYNPSTIIEGFGGHGWLPAPADYDGDQMTDLGIYNPATATLEVRLSHTGFIGVFANNLGGPRCVPVPEDFDGDRIADPAAFEARTGTWDIFMSASEYAPISVSGLGGTALGAPSYASPTADYDGDGIADPAVYQARTGTWFVWLSKNGYNLVSAAGLGGPTWIPAAADYDGDASMDIAVYEQNTGNWMFWLSSLGYTPRFDVYGWGGPEFIPVEPY